MTVECVNCGKAKSIEGSLYRRNKLKNFYCDRECFFKAKQVDTECAYCGKPFTATRGRFEANKSGRACCSRECRDKRKAEEAGVAVECGWCGAALRVSPFRYGRNKHNYCNPECQYKGQAEHLRANETFMAGRSGANHYLWRGGRFPYYGPNWTTQTRRARARDGYRCQHCGMAEEENGRKLDVHHIRPRRAFNGNHEAANRLNNLISLCRACHKRAEAVSV